MVSVTFSGGKVYIDGVLARKVSGSTRHMYMTGTHVVKMDPKRTLFSLLQCNDEVKRWKKVTREDRVFFVPILASGRHDGRQWVCQPRIKGRHRAPKWAHFLVQGMVIKYGMGDVDAFTVEDGYKQRTWNWMMTKDGPRIYDYGL